MSLNYLDLWHFSPPYQLFVMVVFPRVTFVTSNPSFSTQEPLGPMNIVWLSWSNTAKQDRLSDIVEKVCRIENVNHHANLAVSKRFSNHCSMTGISSFHIAQVQFEMLLPEFNNKCATRTPIAVTCSIAQDNSTNSSANNKPCKTTTNELKRVFL